MSENTPVPVGVPQTPTKAIVAGVIAFLSALAAAITVASPDDFKDWAVIVIGALVTAAATYQVPNKARVRNDVGASVLGIVVAIVLAVFFIWLIVALVGHRDHDGGHGNDWEKHGVAAGVLR